MRQFVHVLPPGSGGRNDSSLAAGTGTNAGYGLRSVPLPAFVSLVGGPAEGMWLLLLVAIILAVVAVRAWRERRRSREVEAMDGPFLVFPNIPPASGEPAPMIAPIRPPVPPPPPPPAEGGGETIRFEPPFEETVQLLPGRLVVVGGEDAGREYRFLRSSGQAVPEVTVGRAAGPSGRHLQLRVPTVSRVHARLRFLDKRWTVANASSTNPVRVNGEELGPDAQVTLSDGDRIQLGEVELRYLESYS